MKKGGRSISKCGRGEGGGGTGGDRDTHTQKEKKARVPTKRIREGERREERVPSSILYRISKYAKGRKGGGKIMGRETRKPEGIDTLTNTYTEMRDGRK